MCLLKLHLKEWLRDVFRQNFLKTKTRLTQVREKYLELIEKLRQTENIIIIDGNNSIDEIAADIWKKVSYLFTD